MELFMMIVVISIGSLTVYMLKEAFDNRVIEQTVMFSDLPESFEGMTVFFISDIHRRVISPQIIQEITGKTDIVIIGGDLAERGVPIRRIKDNLLQLRAVAPVYFVWGNNDYEINPQILTSVFKQCNITSLDNSAEVIQSSTGEKLALVGVKDRQFEHVDDYMDDNRLATALRHADDAHFKILISHKPRIIEKILPEHHVQLVLTGHTHGGQIHLFGYSPYERGTIKEIGETVLLISNGYGTTGIPLRLGAKSETHLIRLRRRKKLKCV